MIDKAVDEKKIRKINIFGSCVSRDLFEFDSRKSFRVGEYIARQSIISFLSQAVEFQENSIHLTSKFQKRQIISDWSKDGMERLRKNPGDFLMIDLIDERFKIAKIAGSYVTDSSELEVSGLLNKYSVRVYDKNFFCRRLCFKCRDIGKYVTEFTEKIMEVYSQQQVIIHEVYLAEYFIDKNGNQVRFPENWIQYTQILNKKLGYMYHCLKNNLPDAYCIAISNEFCADERHKWGLAPMHFESRYYKEVMERLYQLL